MGILAWINYLKQLRYMKRVLKKHAHLLLPGEYRMFPSMRALVANHQDIITQASTYFIHHTKSNRENPAVRLINKTSYFTNKKNGTYEAVYVANNREKLREVKLFSFSESKILTFCTGDDTCRNQISEYAELSSSYGMPQTQLYDQKHHAVYVSMITPAPRPAEPHALSTIINCTIKYNTPIRIVEKLSLPEILDFSSFPTEIQQIMSAITNKIDFSAIPTSIPLCMQHGDISQDNLMYGAADGETKFY